MESVNQSVKYLTCHAKLTGRQFSLQHEPNSKENEKKLRQKLVEQS